ncbi:MAG: HEAT repeat domain-containing protein [Gemmatimonadota bacterium]|nr:MAG: HEAT repeat domain-containing protein [Gemmatimonadota bacterium]
MTAILAVYGVMILRDPAHFRMLDHVDLAIHEAGHVFFGPLGEFIGLLGGTLLQLMVPTAFLGYFLYHGNQHAASVLLWWVAQNLWNISVYIKDARSLELPLVGGGEHDWAHLLGELGLLHRDQTIGQTVYLAGVLLFTFSIVWGLMTARVKRNGNERRGTTVLLAVLLLPCVVGCDAQRDDSMPGEIDAQLWQTMLTAEDARAETAEEMSPLYQGLRSEDPVVRQIAVRALGRLERPALVPSIVRLLTDSAASVRAEAANALGQAVYRGGASAAVAPLLSRLQAESDPHVTGVLGQTLGRLPYESSDTVRLVEAALVGVTGAAETATLVGIARGLESLIRRQGRSNPPTPGTIAALSALSVYSVGSGSGRLASHAARIRRLATAALVRSGAGADLPQLLLSDPDPGVKRLAVAGAAAIEPAARRAQVIGLYLADRSAAVRYAALQAYGRYVQPTEGCEPVREALSDADPHVALLAIDLLGNGCGADEEVAETLLGIADSLSRDRTWHRPAHALVSLAKVSRIPAELLLPRFTAHESWWVRMYAARAAKEMGLTGSLRRLAFDPHDNVRQVAIAALSELEQHEADSIYIAQLVRPDYQLVMTAAQALEGSNKAANAMPALLGALALVTAEQRETSRDVRRAVIRRVEELGGPAQAEALEPYLGDFDPVIASEAARVLTGWTGTRYGTAPSPLAAEPLPSYREIKELADSRPVLVMRGLGDIELRLLAFEAPANAARFARLARAGYFDGLTFHRVVPGFVIQGGSPGANEYSGDWPYTRDELTMRSHLRGTVGVSTRGRDTGDGQIFVNLVDNPRLDHNYTIFAEVVDGMELVDRLLEGATIGRIVWR